MFEFVTYGGYAPFLMTHLVSSQVSFVREEIMNPMASTGERLDRVGLFDWMASL